MSAWGNYTPGAASSYGDKGKGKGKNIWRGERLPDITYAGETLSSCRKDIYNKHPTVRGWDAQTVHLIRLANNIEVLEEDHPVDVLAPVNTLDVSSLPEESIKSLRRDMKIETPSPIQMQVWPAAMSGRDLIGVAPTGSGKTLAYLVPMFEHCKAQVGAMRNDEDCGPQALILVPNADLARQIKRTFENTWRANQLLKMELIIPGEKRENYRPCEILVASPGRLLDFLRHNEKTKSGFLRNFFRRTTFVVVDEADSLMVKERDRDGEQHTFEILKSLRSDIQMLYFTATWDDQLPMEISKIFPRNPERPREPLLSVIVNGKTLSACKNVQQIFLRRNGPDLDRDPRSMFLNKFWKQDSGKNDALHNLLYWAIQDGQKRNDVGNSKILVFTNAKETVARLTDLLKENDHPVVGLTGDTWQGDRNRIVMDFADPNKTEKLILVTTDMLGRGIDFTTCRCVILYEFPHHRNGVREYVHRIGRTGRAGREGFAVTLLDEHEGDFRHCKDITHVLEASEQETPRWMVEESYSHKKHLQTYWRRQDQLRRERGPEDREDPAETANGAEASQTEQGGEAYGNAHKEGKVPCSPYYCLERLLEELGASFLPSLEKERQMPSVF